MRLFSNERIRTSDASSAQLLLLDKTSLSIGPHAELALNHFVYNPNRSSGRVVVNAAQGAFRFITGSQNPTHYTIETPVASLGIRGTILDLLISAIRFRDTRSPSSWSKAAPSSRCRTANSSI